MIRVLIERWLRPGAEEAFDREMRALRREAVHRAGYISGETLRDAADRRHLLVLSTWRSREDWEAWRGSSARADIDARIMPCLAQPERFIVLDPV
ncbi:MAG TPA: antibiotic biosynthesis monooxygenase family protein [Candidatus Binatia bacterium]|nr:antibiotic biosynthesis monooxygenase family protein [Candidatus Binatia bacterium]